MGESTYKRGHKFKFLVHAISTDAENALQNAKSIPIISTSLIIDEFQGTYKTIFLSLIHTSREVKVSKAYNEIVLINDSYTNPIAVFLLETENTSEFSVTQAEELATKLNLPLLRI